MEITSITSITLRGRDILSFSLHGQRYVGLPPELTSSVRAQADVTPANNNQGSNTANGNALFLRQDKSSLGPCRETK